MNFWKTIQSLFPQHENNCMRIPLDIQGQLYVSPMPFGPYDKGNVLLKAYQGNRIEFAVVLVTDDELKKKAKRDLLANYEKSNIKPIRFPFADYTSPDLEQVSKLVDQVAGYLRAGAHIAIHCNAGVGRTGVVACCVVRDIMKIPAQEAIDYVKKYMQTNMTDEQTRLIKRFKTLAERLEEKKCLQS